MSKSELMKLAHRYARKHRGEYPRYADALSVGMKLAHARKKELEKEIHREEGKKPFSFSDFSRRGVPLLLQNWLDPAYPHRKDFRELATPPRRRGEREGDRISL